MVLYPVPAFSDNYIWVLDNNTHALVVDPGTSQGVLAYLQARQLELQTILVTHHHADHTEAAEALRNLTGARLMAPRTEWLGPTAERVGGGATFQTLGLEWHVLDVPGHTAGHVAYWADAVPLDPLNGTQSTGTPVLFCGDTLFSAGCGRLFEGTAAEMLASLDKLTQLPESSLVCCTHEYTLSNLRFARVVEPHNQATKDWQDHCLRLRQSNQPTLPTTLALERTINPFLRVRQVDVQQAAISRNPSALTDVGVLATIRQWKNDFQ